MLEIDALRTRANDGTNFHGSNLALLFPRREDPVLRLRGIVLPVLVLMRVAVTPLLTVADFG